MLALSGRTYKQLRTASRQLPQGGTGYRCLNYFRAHMGLIYLEDKMIEVAGSILFSGLWIMAGLAMMITSIRAD